MSQHYTPQIHPQFQPQKKKHTVRNVLLVLAVVFVLGVAGCVAIVGSVGNELAKQAEAPSTQTVPSDRNAPRPVSVGKAFTIGKHQTLAGWTVKEELGMFSVSGKVKNVSESTSTAFFHIKFLKGNDVLGNVQCNSSDLEPGQTEVLNCVPNGNYTKSYDKITAEATF